MNKILYINNQIEIQANFEDFRIWNDHVELNFTSSDTKCAKKFIDCFNKELEITMCHENKVINVDSILEYLKVQNDEQTFDFKVQKDYERLEGLFYFLKKDIILKCKEK